MMVTTHVRDKEGNHFDVQAIADETVTLCGAHVIRERETVVWSLRLCHRHAVLAKVLSRLAVPVHILAQREAMQQCDLVRRKVSHPYRQQSCSIVRGKCPVEAFCLQKRSRPCDVAAVISLCKGGRLQSFRMYNICQSVQSCTRITNRHR